MSQARDIQPAFQDKLQVATRAQAIIRAREAGLDQD